MPNHQIGWKIAVVQQVDKLVGQGFTVARASRAVGITNQQYYWRKHVFWGTRIGDTIVHNGSYVSTRGLGQRTTETKMSILAVMNIGQPKMTRSKIVVKLVDSERRPANSG